MDMYEKPLGSAVPRTRKKNVASKRQKKSYRFNGEMNVENESSDSFCKGACAAILSQRKRFASAIKHFWPGKAAPRAT